MIWPIDEQAHFGTTRYTMLPLSVIQVPGKLMSYSFVVAGSGLPTPAKSLKTESKSLAKFQPRPERVNNGLIR